MVLFLSPKKEAIANTGGHMAIVPHPKKELPIGTTRAIIRQSGLSPGDFGF